MALERLETADEGVREDVVERADGVQPHAPHEVAETVLGHVTDSGVVRAYRRTDYLEQRLALLERWADHVTGGAGQVVKLAGRAS